MLVDARSLEVFLRPHLVGKTVILEGDNANPLSLPAEWLMDDCALLPLAVHEALSAQDFSGAFARADAVDDDYSLLGFHVIAPITINPERLLTFVNTALHCVALNSAVDRFFAAAPGWADRDPSLGFAREMFYFSAFALKVERHQRTTGRSETGVKSSDGRRLTRAQAALLRCQDP